MYVLTLVNPKWIHLIVKHFFISYVTAIKLLYNSEHYHDYVYFSTCTVHLLLSCTYLLTPWCTVLLEKPTGLQLVKKFPAFYGTRRFITALTSVRHLSLSWASPIQSTHPHPTSFMTNKCTIISQIITLHLHVSTLSCHPQGAGNQHLAKLHKYFKCSCW